MKRLMLLFGICAILLFSGCKSSKSEDIKKEEDFSEKIQKSEIVNWTYTFIDTVEKQVMINEFDENAIKFDLSGEVIYKVSDLETFGIDTEQYKFKSDNLVKINTKGIVVEVALEINGYYVYYNGEEVIPSKTKSAEYIKLETAGSTYN